MQMTILTKGETYMWAVLELKLFNHQEKPYDFKIGIYTYYGLFLIYLD